MTDPTPKRVFDHRPDPDPEWMKVLRAVALIIGIVCMVVFLCASWAAYGYYNRVQDALDGLGGSSSTEVPDSETPAVESYTPQPPTDWREEVGPNGERLGCYSDVETGEQICEVIE